VAASATAASEIPTASVPLAQTAASEIAFNDELRRQRPGDHNPAQEKAQEAVAQTTRDAPETPTASEPPMQTAPAETAVKTARKSSARARRPRKSEVVAPSDETKE
jgi:hypothetical protein